MIFPNHSALGGLSSSILSSQLTSTAKKVATGSLGSATPILNPQLGTPVEPPGTAKVDHSFDSSRILENDALKRIRPSDPSPYDTPIEPPVADDRTSLPQLDGYTEFVAKAKNLFFGSDFETIDDGTYQGKRIVPTDGDDVIEIRYDPATSGTFVTVNGETSYLTAEDAHFLFIDGVGANDVVKIDAAYPYPVVQH